MVGCVLVAGLLVGCLFDWLDAFKIFRHFQKDNNFKSHVYLR